MDHTNRKQLPFLPFVINSHSISSFSVFVGFFLSFRLEPRTAVRTENQTCFFAALDKALTFHCQFWLWKEFWLSSTGSSESEGVRLCMWSVFVFFMYTGSCQELMLSVIRKIQSVLPDEGFLHIRDAFYLIGWIKILFSRCVLFFVPFGQFEKLGCNSYKLAPTPITVVWLRLTACSWYDYWAVYTERVWGGTNSI